MSESNPKTKNSAREIPFFIGEGRAMVSLGPLSQKRYCTYGCPFCYVRADFSAYGSLNTGSIVDWLRDRRTQFDVVYISGDTDSFAPPRAAMAVDLLQRLLPLDVDMLFTTRAVIGPKQLDALRAIAIHQRARSRLLLACVSISQLHHPELEPPPIPSPEQRLAQLRFFHTNRFVAILAMRPIMPHIPASEYIEILEKANRSFAAVLGEEWYTDPSGHLEKSVFGDFPPLTDDLEYRKMDFDTNTTVWKVYRSSHTVRTLTEYCAHNGLRFYMRSRPAIIDLRKAITSPGII